MEVGAELVLDDGDGVTNTEYLPWLHNKGIRLDGPTPSLVPAGLHEWSYPEQDQDD